LNQINPEKDFFGNIKNIKIEDIENLKKTAITASKYKTALSKSTQEIDRLRKENTDLKSRVPTLKERMARGERESKLTEENKELSNKLGRIEEYITRMPDEMWQEFKKIVDTVKDERQQNMNRENDMGYELGD
jgi:predicted nuclease with TOPRIM domain